MSSFSAIGKRSRLIAGAGIANLVAGTKMIIKGSGRKESDDIIISHARNVNKTANEAIETLHINKETLVNHNYLVLAANIDEFLSRVTGQQSLTTDIFEEKHDDVSQDDTTSQDVQTGYGIFKDESMSNGNEDLVYDSSEENGTDTGFGTDNFGTDNFGSTGSDGNFGGDFGDESTDGFGHTNDFGLEDQSYETEDDGQHSDFGNEETQSVHHQEDNSYEEFGDTNSVQETSSHSESAYKTKATSFDQFDVYHAIMQDTAKDSKSPNNSEQNSQTEEPVERTVGKAIITIRMLYTNNLRVYPKNSKQQVSTVISKDYPVTKFSDGSVEYGNVEVTINDIPEHVIDTLNDIGARFEKEDFKLEFEPTSDHSEFEKVVRVKKVSGKTTSQYESVSSQSTSDSGIPQSSIASKEYQPSLVTSTASSSQSQSTFSMTNSLGVYGTSSSTTSESSSQSESMLAKPNVPETFVRNDAVEFDVEIVNDSGDTIDSTKATLNLVTKFSGSKSYTHLDERDLHELVSEFEADEEHVSIDLARRSITIMKDSTYEELEESDEFTDSMIEYIRNYRKSLHKVTDRNYYSKYTSVEQAYDELLDPYVISELVFDISDGTHDTYHEDSILRPSQYAVRLVEMNERFEYRLMSKINEIRSHLNLPKLNAISDSYRNRRAVATQSILNALRNASKISFPIESVANGKKVLETSQPTSSLELVGGHHLSPELAADRMLHSILSEVEMIEDVLSSTHIRQLLDEDVTEMTAAMMIVGYSTNNISSEYKVSTTLDYFKN